MKSFSTTKSSFRFSGRGFLLGALLHGLVPCALAQGTAFTYQGRLNDGAGPANGLYDLRFSLYSTSSGGSTLAGPLTNAPTGVTNGFFTVTLDFGDGIFSGPPRWLEIAVRTNGATAAHTALLPRQPLSAAPYAILAGSASNLLGNLAAASVSAGTIATGQVVKSLNGLRDTVTLSPGAFLAFTTNANDLNLAVLSTSSNLPNSLMSRDANGNTALADLLASRLRVGSNQTLSGQFSTIAGGLNNQIQGNADQSAIGGGIDNVIQTASPYSTVGGGADNLIQANAGGATIAGGNANLILLNARSSTIGGGAENTISGIGSFIGGGGADGSDTYGNVIAANASAIGGGYGNSIQANADYSSIGGGFENYIQAGAPHSAIAGGYGNAISGRGSFIGAGGNDGHNSLGNIVRANAAAVAGGYGNVIQPGSDDSSISAGFRNTILGEASFIGSGGFNLVSTNAKYSAISGGYSNRVLGKGSFIGGGGYDGTNFAGNSAFGNASAIGGGYANLIQTNSDFSLIGSGWGNRIEGNAPNAGIAGGYGNVVSGMGSFIGGGGRDGTTVVGNAVRANSSTIGSGYGNLVGLGAHGSFIGSGAFNLIDTNAKYSAISGGFSNRVLGKGSFIGGGGFDGTNFEGNVVLAGACVIGGGCTNSIQTNSDYSFVGGGRGNRIEGNSDHAVIVGGNWNRITGSGSFLGGGGINSGGLDRGNVIDADSSVIVGGIQNQIQANAHNSALLGGRFNIIATNAVGGSIGGGANNLIDVGINYCTIAGGYNNLVKGEASCIPGGELNQANGDFTFAAGFQALAIHEGAFVWAGGLGGALSSTAINQFTARASGGVRFFSNLGATLGVQLAPNGTSWTALSDRNAKNRIESVNPVEILDKLIRLPISNWSYKDDATHRRYIGPMAQDFHAAFQLGEDDKRINTMDTDGVTLAAIQGLNQKLETENAQLQARVATLEEQLERKQIRLTKIEEEFVIIKAQQLQIQQLLAPLWKRSAATLAINLRKGE